MIGHTFNIINPIVAQRGLLRILKSWENEVAKRVGFSKKQKNMMLMPEETHLGIEVTGMCIY